MASVIYFRLKNNFSIVFMFSLVFLNEEYYLIWQVKLAMMWILLKRLVEGTNVKFAFYYLEILSSCWNVGIDSARYASITMLKSKCLLNVKRNLFYYEESHEHDKNIGVTCPSIMFNVSYRFL